jgi:hypothetical protein
MGLILNTQKATVIVISCCVVLFCYSFKVHAAQSSKVITPELLQLALNAAGIAAEIVRMDSDSGFGKGLQIDELQGASVLIGFPAVGIQREQPFLLSIAGKDSIVKLADSGGLVILDEGAMFYKQADYNTLSVAGCILDAVGDMVDTIDDCGANVFCIIGAVFSAVGDIMDCL